MAFKIAVFNQKGGVAKTTTAKAIAGELSRTHSKRVLLIDCDASANATQGLSHEVEPEINLSKMLIDWCDEEIEYDDYSVCIVPTAFPNLFLVPANRKLMLKADSLMLRASFSTNNLFEQILAGADDDYDYIILDIGAGEGTKFTSNALCYSDYVLVPFEPSIESVRGYNNVRSKIKEAQRDNRKLQLLGGFLTKYRQTSTSRDTFTIAQEIMGECFIPIPIRFSVDTDKSSLAEKPLCYFNPYSNPAKDYAALTEWVRKKVEQ